MADKLDAILKKPLMAPVYYLASTETEPLREGAGRLRRALLAAEGADSETTVIEGPAPNLGEVVASAGAVSFFGSKRVVELREISPSTMREKDVEELAALFGEVDSAVLIVTSLYKDKATAKGKKAKLLFSAATAAGTALELQKPGRAENLAYLRAQAEALDSAFAPGAAEALLEMTGDDRPLLANEVARLAAMAGYGTIGRDLVEAHAQRGIEADVFELAGAITAGRAAAAYRKLGQLLELKHEPIAIAGALAGTYVDMYRVRVGIEAKKNLNTIYEEMGYRGNPYRMQKARDNAAAYTTPRLQRCLLSLAGLDRRLKSSALPDKSMLLLATVGELMALRNRR